MTPRRTYVDRLFDLCGVAFAVIGALGLLALVGLTVVGVLWRYALNDPIFGLIDISTMTSATVVACAVAWAALKQAHVIIALAEGHFSEQTLRRLDRVINFATALLFLVACQSLLKKSACGFACGDITDNLALSHRPFYLALAVSMAFCAALSLWRSLRPTPPKES